MKDAIDIIEDIMGPYGVNYGEARLIREGALELCRGLHPRPGGGDVLDRLAVCVHRSAFLLGHACTGHQAPYR